MKPNIIIIVLDCVRHDQLGCTGSKDVKTPAIDSIASEGIVFTNAVCHAPFTTPSITSMLTGLYPFNHGVRLLIGQHLPKSIPYASEIFKEAGYYTAAFPSVFLFDKKYGFDRGFDLYDDKIETVRKGFRGPWRPGNLTTERVIDFLEERPVDKPFFAFIHYFDAHDYDPGQEVSFNNYVNKITETDRYINQLFMKLKEDGLWENTIIIITGDHGDEFFSQHGFFGHGKTLYDDVLRVPLLIRAPRLINSRVPINQQVRHIDILPTLLDYSEINKEIKLDGTSLKSIIGGKKKELFSYAETSPVQLYTGDILEEKRFKGSEIICLRSNTYKYIQKTEAFNFEKYNTFKKKRRSRIMRLLSKKNSKIENEELYKIIDDPNENKNLAKKMPDTCIEFRKTLEKLVEEKSQNLEVNLTIGSKTDEEIMRERLKTLGYIE